MNQLHRSLFRRPSSPSAPSVPPINEGDLILINREHPLRRQVNKLHGALVPSVHGSEVLLEGRCALHFQRLLAACFGTADILPVSGYRSEAEQRQIYRASVQDHGADFTARFVARPNESEHQTGLAIDVGRRKAEVDFLCPDFPYEGVCNTFRTLAPDYGFLQRYERGKEHINGIAHEPWHFRYVGRPHAAVMRDNGLCLEEYHDFIKAYRYDGKPLSVRCGGDAFALYYCPAQELGRAMAHFPDTPFVLSGNNNDGLIATVRR